MDKKTLPIFVLLLAIVVVMVSVLGRRVSTQQAASVSQPAQSIAPEEGTVVAMTAEPAEVKETRAIDRSQRHLTRSTPKKTATLATASAEKPRRVYRRGRKPLPDNTEVALATTGADKSGGWVTIPGTGVPVLPKAKP